jgi:hypothetical protein
MSIEVITETPLVEDTLRRHRDALGEDFEGYRNHVYRDLTFALHLLGGHTDHRTTLELALCYHDLGLWTDRALAYLRPSIDHAFADALAQGHQVEERLLRDVIAWHHKITPFRGPHAEIVNAVRRADWLDVTQLPATRGVSVEEARRVREALPSAGFHRMLPRIGPELSGSTLRAGVELRQVFRW